MLVNCISGASEVWGATGLDIQTMRAWQEAHRGGFGTRCEAPEIRLMKRKERSLSFGQVLLAAHNNNASSHGIRAPAAGGRSAQ